MRGDVNLPRITKGGWHLYYAGNRLLASLRLQRVNACLISVAFDSFPSERYSTNRERVEHVYFLTSGIASVVLPMIDGQVVKLLLVGPEGMAGMHQLAGPANFQASCFIQLNATGYRVRLEQLQSALVESEELNFEFVSSFSMDS